MTDSSEQTTGRMPAISLWQPYASLIAVGAKPYETRHWCAPKRLIGQRIAIHAAARKPTRAELDEIFDDVADALGFCHWHLRVPYGAVVCTAYLAGSYQVTHWNGQKPVLAVKGEIEDDGFGDYHTGRWCWELRDVQPYKEPIPAKGAQGWWNWNPLGDAVVA